MTETGKCILLVEDNPDDAELTIQALQRNRIANQIVYVSDGEAARDFLFAKGPYKDRNPKDTPDLILLDLKLPKIDGLDVLRRIRADMRTSVIPVVVLTSSAHEDDLVRSYGLGANSYVRKPVKFEDFNRAIAEVAMYWMIVNEPPPKPITADEPEPNGNSQGRAA